MQFHSDMVEKRIRVLTVLSSQGTHTFHLPCFENSTPFESVETLASIAHAVFRYGGTGAYSLHLSIPPHFNFDVRKQRPAARTVSETRRLGRAAGLPANIAHYAGLISAL